MRAPDDRGETDEDRLPRFRPIGEMHCPAPIDWADSAAVRKAGRPGKYMHHRSGSAGPGQSPVIKLPRRWTLATQAPRVVLARAAKRMGATKCLHRAGSSALPPFADTGW